MPFQNFAPRSFREAEIRGNVPALSGVYGLSNAREWILIAETDNLQASLLQHLQQAATQFPQPPSGFVFEVSDQSARAGRKNRLIAEYSPAGNRPR